MKKILWLVTSVTLALPFLHAMEPSKATSGPKSLKHLVAYKIKQYPVLSESLRAQLKEAPSDIQAFINSILMEGNQLYFFEIFRPFLKSESLSICSQQPIAVMVSPDSKFLIAVGPENTLYLWDLQQSLSSARKLGSHTKTITSGSFSNDSQTYITASEDGTIKLWPLTDEIAEPVSFNYEPIYRDLRPLTIGDPSVTQIKVSPNNRFIALLIDGSQGSLCVIDGVRKSYASNASSADMIDFDPAGRYLIAVQANTSFILFTYAENELNTLYEYESSDKKLWYNESAFSPCGSYLLLISREGLYQPGAGQSKVTLWNMKDPEHPQLLSTKILDEDITAAQVASDGTYQLQCTTGLKQLKARFGTAEKDEEDIYYSLDDNHPVVEDCFMIILFLPLNNTVITFSYRIQEHRWQIWNLTPIAEKYNAELIYKFFKAITNGKPLDPFSLRALIK